MSRLIALLIGSAVLAAPELAPAAPADPAMAAYDACMTKSDQSNAAYDDCGGALVAAEDARLNETWRKVYADLEPATKAALLDEQRAWIAYKEKACQYWASGDYGREGQVIDYALCRAGVITDRIAYLGNVGNEGAPDPAR
jgi:uncharacterized protein YecT (DUF1311 family)